MIFTPRYGQCHGRCDIIIFELSKHIAKMDIEITEAYINSEKIDKYIQCFHFSNEKFICKVKECNSSFGKNSSAIRHLKAVHHKIASAIETIKIGQTKPESVEIRVKISLSEIWNSIVRLIVFNGLPFMIINSTGFRNLVKPFVNGLKDIGIDLTVDDLHLKTHIKEKAEVVNKKITEEVKGKLLCLMLDIASRHNRSIFGINIGFFANGKINIRTIGMQTLTVSQTGRNLFEKVKKSLSNYSIDLDQIFTVTTDNGKNLIKMIGIAENEMEQNIDFSDCNTSDESSDDESPSSNDEQSDEIFDPSIFNGEYFRDLLSDVSKEFDCRKHTVFDGISCAAHGLSLVVKEAIKKCPEIKQLIDKSRKLVKKLRTPKMRGALKDKNLKMALIDVKTRWSSVYKMVSFKFYIFVLQ